jgi:hypothetical protein
MRKIIELIENWDLGENGYLKSYNMVNSYVQYRRQPSIEILFEIAKILKVDPKELFSTNKENKK